MRAIPLQQLEQGNALVRRDYSNDFRGSQAAADLPLELPDTAERERGFTEIQEGLALPLSTLRELFAAIADGRHILLFGPPGTGKTSLARRVAGTLFNCDTRQETAVPDWTTFETVGGLQLATQGGREHLEPVAGVITRAVLDCLGCIGTRTLDGNGRQGVWLVIDELNRANMDAAFGPYFTALDQDHRKISLPFFDDPRKELVIPKRFRIVGTMNTYDKNFLFRLSYALTRRFALIPIDVPPNTDQTRRQDEREKLWSDLVRSLNDRLNISDSVAELQRKYDDLLMKPLYDELVTIVRAPQSASTPGGLGRPVGFAHIAAALRHAVVELELGLEGHAGGLVALDRGVRSSIVPQLEGLPNNSLNLFLGWWRQQANLQQMTESITAVQELIDGASLFVTG